MISIITLIIIIVVIIIIIIVVIIFIFIFVIVIIIVLVIVIVHHHHHHHYHNHRHHHYHHLCCFSVLFKRKKLLWNPSGNSSFLAKFVQLKKKNEKATFVQKLCSLLALFFRLLRQTKWSMLVKTLENLLDLTHCASEYYYKWMLLLLYISYFLSLFLSC